MKGDSAHLHSGTWHQSGTCNLATLLKQKEKFGYLHHETIKTTAMNFRREQRRSERQHRRTERRVRRRRKQLWGSNAAANDPLDDVLPDKLKPYKFWIWLHIINKM